MYYSDAGDAVSTSSTLDASLHNNYSEEIDLFSLPRVTCHAVPRTTCQAVPHVTCPAVPRFTCQAVPRFTCQAVPHVTCPAVPHVTCQAVPRFTCQAVPPRQMSPFPASRVTVPQVTWYRSPGNVSPLVSISSSPTAFYSLRSNGAISIVKSTRWWAIIESATT